MFYRPHLAVKQGVMDEMMESSDVLLSALSRASIQIHAPLQRHRRKHMLCCSFLGDPSQLHFPGSLNGIGARAQFLTPPP